MNIVQSNIVGLYIAHEEGKKSRFKLVTMMTKRSSHMPALTISEIMKSQKALSRNLLNQRSCIEAPLHNRSSQYIYQYGPSQMRFLIMNTSYCEALYQPKKASIT